MRQATRWRGTENPPERIVVHTSISRTDQHLHNRQPSQCCYPLSRPTRHGETRKRRSLKSVLPLTSHHHLSLSLSASPPSVCVCLSHNQKPPGVGVRSGRHVPLCQSSEDHSPLVRRIRLSDVNQSVAAVPSLLAMCVCLSVCQCPSLTHSLTDSSRVKVGRKEGR